MLEGTISRLQLVDPTTHPVIPEFSGAPRVNDMTNARVGIIDDSKVNAKEYLHELISLLDERYGVSNVEYHFGGRRVHPGPDGHVHQPGRTCRVCPLIWGVKPRHHLPHLHAV